MGMPGVGVCSDIRTEFAPTLVSKEKKSKKSSKNKEEKLFNCR